MKHLIFQDDSLLGGGFFHADYNLKSIIPLREASLIDILIENIPALKVSVTFPTAKSALNGSHL